MEKATREHTKFTDRYIDKLKPQEREYRVVEGRGFAIRVYPNGTKTFVYIFTLHGKKRLLNLGSYPSVTLAQARVAYAAAYQQVKTGVDPVEAQKIVAAEEKAAEHSELTFTKLLEKIPKGFIPHTIGQLAAVYLIKYSKEHHTPAVHRNLTYTVKGLVRSIGHMSITAFKRKDAIALVERVAKHKRGQANNVLKAGRQMYEYALQREWADAQPFTGVLKAVPAAAGKSADRYLTDDEIRQAWERISACSGGDSAKRALKLILVTAQRPGEVAQLHSSQISGEWWTIPGNVAKNGRAHRVYLTSTARHLIGEGKGYVFPSRSNAEVPVRRASLAQLVKRKALGGVNPWHPHDLRRTARTNLSRLKVVEEVAEAVINHQPGKLVGIYNLYEYTDEKREAMLKWEAMLKEILGELI